MLEKYQGLNWKQDPLEPATIRFLLRFLLQLERVTRKYLTKTHLLEEQEFESVRKIIQDAISPKDIAFYSHQVLAAHILKQIDTNSSLRETPIFKNYQKFQDSISLIPSSKFDKDRTSKELIHQFIEISKIGREEDAYAAVLGYEMSGWTNDMRQVGLLKRMVNYQRIGEVVGTGVLEAVEECRRWGILGEDLPVYTIERLGRLWERKGGESRGFMEGLKKAQKEVGVRRMARREREKEREKEGNEMRDEADRTIGRRALGLPMAMAGTESLYRDAGIEGYAL